VITSARLPLTVLALLCGLSAIAPAGAAQYAVEGLNLGDRIDTNGQNYRSYSCRPSEDFAEATWCSRSQQRSTKGRNVTVSNTIVHTADRTTLYLMSNAQPVMLTRAAIQAEINQLSREIGEQPAKIEWHPQFQSPGAPTSVLVTWGSIKLEELRGDPIQEVEAGRSPKLGLLVDTLGDLKRSATENYPVYRIAGGRGYLFTASFDASGRGHRHQVAVDGAQMTAKHYELTLQRILARDQTVPANDYQLWKEVAVATRRFALDTSARTANEVMDRVFANVPSKKLRSRAWSILPGGAIEHMAMHQFGTIDIYGTKTEHPPIRRAIQEFLAANPSEPFAEFLHYVTGDYEKALQVNPNSPISDVFHFAAGYSLAGALAREAIMILDPANAKDFAEDEVDRAIGHLNTNPDLYKDKLLSNVVPNFAARAAVAQAHFQAVLRNPTAPHADDAAYMLGWLNLHQGKIKEATAYFGQAMVVGNDDYKIPAHRRMVRILAGFPPREQAAIVEADRNLARQPVLWYVAARAAYRELDYALAINAAERALKALDVPLDRLPASTDPKVIDSAIEKINPELSRDYNMSEIPYLLEASREILRYLDSLKAIAAERPDVLTRRSRAVIIKYSKLIDDQAQQGGQQQRTANTELAHRDLRQALHMIDTALATVPKTAPYAKLREWLYYRKVRVSVVFAPKTVTDVVAAMEQEFPTSALLDDVMAEQIFAQGLMLKDLPGAQAIFRKLLEKFPRGNAVDNAHTWMAIIYRCEGRAEDALAMNREIIRRFPNTRHAMYARERMAEPDACRWSNER